jgi:hypothetical protein
MLLKRLVGGVVTVLVSILVSGVDVHVHLVKLWMRKACQKELAGVINDRKLQPLGWQMLSLSRTESQINL